MTHLDSVLKSRDITLPTKIHLVKAMVFPVVIYGCENWTIKKAEYWRIDAFKLEKTGVGEDSWESLGLQDQTSQPKGNQSWIFIRRPDPDEKSWLIRKTLMLEKAEGRRIREWQRTRFLGGITDSMNMSLCKFQEMVKDREAWHAEVRGVTKSQTWLREWTTLFKISKATQGSFQYMRESWSQ